MEEKGEKLTIWAYCVEVYIHSIIHEHVSGMRNMKDEQEAWPLLVDKR